MKILIPKAAEPIDENNLFLDILYGIGYPSHNLANIGIYSKKDGEIEMRVIAQSTKHSGSVRVFVVLIRTAPGFLVIQLN